MLAPFATLGVLSAVWLIAKVMLELADGDGAKILAALRGNSPLALPVQSVRPITVRFRPRAESFRQPMHVQPEWRAAA